MHVVSFYIDDLKSFCSSFGKDQVYLGHLDTWESIHMMPISPATHFPFLSTLYFFQFSKGAKQLGSFKMSVLITPEDFPQDDGLIP